MRCVFYFCCDSQIERFFVLKFFEGRLCVVENVSKNRPISDDLFRRNNKYLPFNVLSWLVNSGESEFVRRSVSFRCLD